MLKKSLQLLAIFVLFNVSGCGVIDAYYLPVSEDTASEIFDAASVAMQAEQYNRAEELYSKLQAEFPFSPYAYEAELNLGDALFLQGKYLEAAQAYKAFEELHPRNEAIPYVLYQIGMSLMNVNTSADRTSSEAAEAIQYFERLMATYPQSLYAEQARVEILNAKTLLAEHELYQANVFWHMGNSGAAYHRYLYVYEAFPELPEVRAYAEEQAKAAFIEYTEDMSEAERREIHGSWHDLFDWL